MARERTLGRGLLVHLQMNPNPRGALPIMSCENYWFFCAAPIVLRLGLVRIIPCIFFRTPQKCTYRHFKTKNDFDNFLLVTYTVRQWNRFTLRAFAVATSRRMPIHLKRFFFLSKTHFDANNVDNLFVAKAFRINTSQNLQTYTPETAVLYRRYIVNKTYVTIKTFKVFKFMFKLFMLV